MPRVEGFLPSQYGLHFLNAFPKLPLKTITFGDNVSIDLGNAANGLCGGMVFAVIDYFTAHKSPPPDPNAPSDSNPLFDFLVDRLIDSFDLPLGPLRYMQLMDPRLPDGQRHLFSFPIPPYGRSWVMIKQEWPRIKRDVDNNELASVGLIRQTSLNPLDLRFCHHVLAYGYDLQGDVLSLNLYDPNYPNQDDVTLSLSLADPFSPAQVTYSKGDKIICFFHTHYRPTSAPLPG